MKVSLDGIEHEFDSPLTIMQALTLAGIPIPSLCHDPRLEPLGGCRLCLVEIAGNNRPAPACAEPLAEGMVIRTRTPELEGFRRTQLKMLAWGYPRDAVEKFPDKPFHKLLREYGLADAARGGSVPALVDDSHPHLRVDLSRCVSCFRCERICDEVQGQFVWQSLCRGENIKLAPGTAPNLAASACVSCGACADTCPTGAIEDRTAALGILPERTVATTCCYCGTGCGLEIGVRDGKIVAAKPALNAPVNHGHACVKGRYAIGFNHAPDRVTTPLIRKNGGWTEVSWDEATGFIAEQLTGIVARHGPDAVGLLGSARATNEENYLMQKFARAVVGTNNVDCCARVCHTPSAAALKRVLGAGAATNSFDEIETAARLFFVCGANPTENHPIVGAKIKRAVRRGAKLIVVDPRVTELAALADLHLAIRPGTNVPLFNAMAHVIIAERLADEKFLAARVEGFDGFRDFTAAFTPEKAAAICGIEAGDIRRAARLYARTSPAMSFHGLGLTEHTQGTEAVMALINLALLTGNLGKPGSGVNPLRGQNNVQGSAMMGCDPGNYAGLFPVKSPEVRGKFERAWGVSLPAGRGMNLLDMTDAAAAGKLKALWAFGYDVYLSLANAAQVGDAFEKLELVVIQDLFLNETAKTFGTVFLPAASPFEKDGTFMNSDRRVQRVREVVPPPGLCRPDWIILRDVAGKMGLGALFDYESPEKIWDEIRSLWPAGAGLSYARIERDPAPWPCPSETHPGTPFLHRDSFGFPGKASLQRIDFIPTPEVTDADYPFLLNTGRNLYHFNAGTMTFRAGNETLLACDFLDIAPADARRLGLKNGDRAVVRSRYGEAILPTRPNNAIKPGELFATFHDARTFLNRVTGPHRDNIVKAPEYKITAVALKKA